MKILKNNITTNDVDSLTRVEKGCFYSLDRSYLVAVDGRVNEVTLGLWERFLKLFQNDNDYFKAYFPNAETIQCKMKINDLRSNIIFKKEATQTSTTNEGEKHFDVIARSFKSDSINANNIHEKAELLHDNLKQWKDSSTNLVVINDERYEILKDKLGISDLNDFDLGMLLSYLVLTKKIGSGFYGPRGTSIHVELNSQNTKLDPKNYGYHSATPIATEEKLGVRHAAPTPVISKASAENTASNIDEQDIFGIISHSFISPKIPKNEIRNQAQKLLGILKKEKADQGKVLVTSTCLKKYGKELGISNFGYLDLGLLLSYLILTRQIGYASHIGPDYAIQLDKKQTELIETETEAPWVTLKTLEENNRNKTTPYRL